MVSRTTKIAILIIIAVVAFCLLTPVVILGIFIRSEMSRPKDSGDPDEKMFSMTDYDVVSGSPVSHEGYLNEGESYRYDYMPHLGEGDLLRLIRVKLGPL